MDECCRRRKGILKDKSQKMGDRINSKRATNTDYKRE